MGVSNGKLSPISPVVKFVYYYLYLSTSMKLLLLSHNDHHKPSLWFHVISVYLSFQVLDAPGTPPFESAALVIVVTSKIIKISEYWWYLYYSEFFIFDMLSFIYLKLYSLRLQVLNWLSENIKIIGQYEIYWSSISRILYPRRKRAWKSDCNTYFFLNFTCFYHNSIHSSQEQ